MFTRGPALVSCVQLWVCVDNGKHVLPHCAWNTQAELLEETQTPKNERDYLYVYGEHYQCHQQHLKQQTLSVKLLGTRWERTLHKHCIKT